MNVNDDPLLRPADVRRRLDRAAKVFDSADVVHRRTLDGLLERLEPVQIDPRRVLDLGSVTGSGSRRFAKRWRKARIVSVEASLGMLRRCRRERRSWLSRLSEAQADAQALPFRTGSFDAVLANLSLPWMNGPGRCFAEVARVLRREGLFAFATLGPDSFRELRDAWREVDAGLHVHPFADMHNIGDGLVRAGLRDPVLDVEKITLTYARPADVYRDLSATGARNVLSRRAKGLTSSARVQRFEAALCGSAAGQEITITLELVFGHAWGAGPPSDPGEFRLDPANIGRMRRNP